MTYLNPRNTFLLASLLLLAGLPACDATETGGSSGPPSAPRLHHPVTPQAEVGNAVFALLQEQRPSSIAWSRGGELFSIDYFSWGISGTLVRYERQEMSPDAVSYSADYSYDASDRLLSEDWDLNGDAEIDYTASYDYDAGGALLKKTITHDGPSLGVDYNYDGQGQLDFLTKTSGGKSASTTIDYVYDAQGVLLERREGTTGAEVHRVERFDYDTQGREIELGFYFEAPFNTAVEAVRHSYDSTGQLAEVGWYYKADRSYYSELFYGGSGDLESIVWRHRDTPGSQWDGVVAYDN